MFTPDSRVILGELYAWSAVPMSIPPVGSDRSTVNSDENRITTRRDVVFKPDRTASRRPDRENEPSAFISRTVTVAPGSIGE